jgi:hypothetical protein
MTEKSTILLISGVACAIGIALIIVARSFAGEVSWGTGWIINAIGWLILAAVIIPACAALKQMEVKMKYVVAVIACGGLFLLYAVIGATLGWRHGGGIIPMMILLSIVGAVWTVITRSASSSDNKTKKEPPSKPPPPPFAGFQDIPKESRKDNADKKLLSDGGR